MPLRARFASAGVLTLALAAPLVAQQPLVPTYAPLTAAPAPTANVGLVQVGLVLGAGALTALLVDRPAQRLAFRNSGDESAQLSGVAKRFGQPEAYATVALGLMGAGLVSGNGTLARSGLRVAGSVALASLVVQLGKTAIGRVRPDAAQGSDADELAPLTAGANAFPSGHTAAAFALATSLADDLHSPVASVALYGLATATGIARIQQNRHWASDVVVGAAVGIASAKFIGRRWTVFGIRAPQFLVGPQGVGVSMRAEF